jgi:peroxiredoxin
MRSFTFLLLASCLGLSMTASAAETAPGFTLPDSEGAPVNLAKYKGKVVLLDFWATWCHGCKLEIPWFMEFEKKYKHSGLAVIGVSMDDDGWKLVKPFIKEKGMNYPVVVGNQDLAKLYGLTSLPVTLLIDREGKIAATHVGMVDKDAFESELRKLLQAGK